MASLLTADPNQDNNEHTDKENLHSSRLPSCNCGPVNGFVSSTSPYPLPPPYHTKLPLCHYQPHQTTLVSLSTTSFDGLSGLPIILSPAISIVKTQITSVSSFQQMAKLPQTLHP